MSPLTREGSARDVITTRGSPRILIGSQGKARCILDFKITSICLAAVVNSRGIFVLVMKTMLNALLHREVLSRV